MPAVNLSPIFNATAITDANGNLLNAGRLFTYQAGSTIPLASYTDSDGTITRTNPIVAGVDGKVLGLIWLEANVAYKFVLQNSIGVQIATYDNVSGVITSTPAVQLLPTGMITIWSGAIGNIPSGWALCDGQAGRPDLRDKFIVGAGNLYPPTTQGGSADAVVVTHNHAASVVDPGHFHITRADPGTGTSGAFGGGVSTAATDITSSTNQTNVSVTIANAGQSGTNANLPPYYALAYIIRL